ncbi:replication factor A protein 1-like [Galendromus occidentalis]|uniref:Replication factor A protein 1-like n=1 Tax=Galendromus occidentalis TaxID=34638 RepID=A0AAJ6QQ72_9ACAR|nr:replication factor A protein 1-like [Galendromus occidentalis]
MGKCSPSQVVDASTDIQIVAFNDNCLQFSEILQEHQEYDIEGFACRQANPIFNTTSSKLEIVLNKGTKIRALNRATLRIAEKSPNYVSFSELQSMKENDIVDVCGVIIHVSPVEEFTRKRDGKPIVKRELRIVDEDRKILTINLWNERTNTELVEKVAVSVRHGRINIFRGNLSLNCESASKIDFDLGNERLLKLSQWWENTDSRLPATTLRIVIRS